MKKGELMAKEWILNMATNRWGLNKKNSVGPVSQWIRECNPRSIKDWEEFYYSKLAEFLKSKGMDISPQEYLEDLGRKLYVKITEVIQAEIPHAVLGIFKNMEEIILRRWETW